MSETPQKFPLLWPQGRPRTAGISRRNGQFNKKVPRAADDYRSATESLTIADALKRLRNEIERLGARDPILSSNLKLNRDGSPNSGQSEPADPGVALYFNLGGKPHCMPCDTFKRAADNIAAVAAHIEATRAIERYGVSDLATMFTGFLALPPAGAARPWRAVMGFPEGAAPSPAELKARYRTLAMDRHPDQKKDSGTAMAELNAARDEAVRALGHDTKALG